MTTLLLDSCTFFLANYLFKQRCQLTVHTIMSLLKMYTTSEINTETNMYAILFITTCVDGLTALLRPEQHAEGWLGHSLFQSCTQGMCSHQLDLWLCNFLTTSLR